MILADKILALRKKNGWSQEELAEKLNVTRQSISKWESAASIPDINKILDLASIFGVTTDYLLHDSMEIAEYTSGEPEGAPRLSAEQANEFMSAWARHAKRIALGVALCICAPVPLIAMAGFAQEGAGAGLRSGALLSGLGVVILLLMVACGAAVLIISSTRAEKYRYIQKGEFELEYGVSGIVAQRRSAFEGKFAGLIAVGVALCILCAVPLIVAGLADAADLTLTLLAALVLVVVAFAVTLFINAGMIKSSYDQLLGQGEFSAEERKHTKRTDRIGGIYWPCVTAVYLAWSFITGNWQFTWIVWPVAGVAFAGLCEALRKTEE